MPSRSFVMVADIHNVDVPGQPGPTNRDATVLSPTAGNLCSAEWHVRDSGSGFNSQIKSACIIRSRFLVAKKTQTAGKLRMIRLC